MTESWRSKADAVRARLRIRSLRLRIQIWHASVLAVVVLLFASIVYLQREKAIIESIDEELSAAVEVIHATLQAADPDTIAKLKESSVVAEGDGKLFEDVIDDERVQQLLAELTIPDTFRNTRYRRPEDAPYLLVTSDGTVLRRLGVVPLAGGISRVRDGRGAVLRIYNQDSVRVALGRITAGMIIRIGRNAAPDFNQLERLAWLLAMGGLAVFAIGLAGGWWLAGRTVQPIQKLSEAASEISEHNLKTELDPGETDLEFKQLAETLNSTFARLDAAFTRQRDFTADASHELRTPLSVLQMHQELALSKERSPEEYVETLQTCQRSANRMHHLIQSLLALARLDEGVEGTTFARVALSQIVTDSLDQLKTLAESRSIQFAVETTASIVMGNADQLQQVVMNLLENAITWSEPSQRVTVRVIDKEDMVQLQVEDEGIGIPESDMRLVFDRFYRVDKQRSRDTGGSGLGLAICQSIVMAHDGTITAESTLGKGSIFTVTFPKRNSDESEPHNGT